MDLAESAAELPAIENEKSLEISSVTGLGINTLKSLIKQRLFAASGS
jgi:hypothetical protein